MTAFSRAGGFAVALAAASILAPAAGWAQAAPASWATKDGRWNNWKDASFATSTAHYEALRAAAKGGTRHTKLTAPEWSGLWTNSNFVPGTPTGWGQTRFGLGRDGKVVVIPGNYSVGGPPRPGAPSPDPPVLTPEAANKLQEELIRVSKGIEWDYVSYCVPAGFPRWYTVPFLREFVTKPNETWMINEMQSETRRIYTDGRGHVPEDERYALWDGDSIGFWDDDTLIIHTISTKPGTWARSAPEYSDKTETVELVKLNADGQIETRMTIYDPANLQKPWRLIFGSSPVPVTGTPNLRIDMWSCGENNNVTKTAEGSTDFVLPGEKGYKDPGDLLKPPK